MELDNRYNPKEAEDRIYAFWQEKGLFAAKANPDKKPFCIVIPPPNVTGILHMGHALNNSYQDILIRLKRMQGFESLWMPGTDHAGIATQNVVERQLAKEGIKRQDLGREKFLERVRQWKEEYGSTIIRQLKKLGSSCDWERCRFTMDEEYSQAVKEVFVRLWDKGLIYQDDKIINWCPRCQTALSDEESARRELDGKLYYIRYPIKESSSVVRPSLPAGRQASSVKNHIIVATTRPETMLGDTAVAVNPKDRRYKNLIGQTVILPLVERQIKIIADDFVDSKFGSGAVKVTPAHDPNDYEMGKRHNLEFLNIMHPDAVLNTNAGEYSGRDRFEAREAIIEDLKERKLLEKIEPHKHSVGHCYRCNTVVEPYLSRQWFVKMRPLAGPAIEAVKDGRIKFYPKRWTKVYLNWMENIRDWCVSRQIWWGHRIPVWYCLDCKKEAIASVEPPKACRACKSSNLKQDTDVLDTWFSSWLWPFATFGWPLDSSSLVPRPSSVTEYNTSDLNYFYPTSVLVTAPEIIFFWVARMIMAGFEFMGSEPFKDVYIHGTVRDAQGKKMSKSSGNIIDPLSIIDKYGADALRFSLISITAGGQDVYLSEQKFELGRNFANKLWNASRFSLMNLDLSRRLWQGEAKPRPSGLVDTDLCVFFKKENLGLPERWILSRFYSMLGALNKALEKYRFNQAANILYEFIWHEFCDWYLELVKPILVSGLGSSVSGQNRNTQIVLYKVLEKTLRCLHPFMPFITEEIWQKLRPSSVVGRPSSAQSIMVQPWPRIQKQMIDRKAERQMRLAIEVITVIRNMRSQMNVLTSQKVNVSAVSQDRETVKALEEVSGYIVNLAKLENFNIQTAGQKAAVGHPIAQAAGQKAAVGLPISQKAMVRLPMAAAIAQANELNLKKGISAIAGNIRIHLELEGLMDIGKEVERITKEISSLSAYLKAKESRLKNKDFIGKAPAEVVEKEKEALILVKEKLAQLNRMIDELK